ncbi:MAG: hypothetical protein HYV08_10385 [Deltaproteobacteria bacterium]|nr:hypothetical protein [Deltaproteobacteria bacterium]MBI3079771.1 hypothetical protein [Deltaproteobacteria bacterium]
MPGHLMRVTSSELATVLMHVIAHWLRSEKMERLKRDLGVSADRAPVFEWEASFFLIWATQQAVSTQGFTERLAREALDQFRDLFRAGLAQSGCSEAQLRNIEAFLAVRAESYSAAIRDPHGGGAAWNLSRRAANYLAGRDVSDGLVIASVGAIYGEHRKALREALAQYQLVEVREGDGAGHAHGADPGPTGDQGGEGAGTGR